MVARRASTRSRCSLFYIIPKNCPAEARSRGAVHRSSNVPSGRGGRGTDRPDVPRNCSAYAADLRADRRRGEVLVLYYFDPDGGYYKRQLVPPALAHCFFEWNYFADRDSIVEGLSVKKLRRALGEMLAEELELERVEFVSYFPRAPEDAARGLARVSGKPFQPLFYKLRGERAFQGPTPDERSQSISQNIST